MIRTIGVFFIIIGLLFGCNPSSEYGKGLSRVIYSDDSQLVEGFMKDSLETGYWEFKNKAGVSLKRGEYMKGVPVGEWKYLIDGQEKSFSWELFSNPDSSLRLPIKNRMSVEYDLTDKLIFRAIGKERLQGGSQILVSIYPNLDSSFTQYEKMVLFMFENRGEVKKLSVREYVEHGVRFKVFFFDLQKEQTIIKIKMALILKNNIIINLTYSVPEGLHDDLQNYVFTEMIYHLYYNKERVLNIFSPPLAQSSSVCRE